MNKTEMLEWAIHINEIVEAYVDGKTIQWYDNIDDMWKDDDSFDPTDGLKYRIKPREPREFWVCWSTEKYPKDLNHVRVFPSPAFDGCVSNWKSHIKVREVIE